MKTELLETLVAFQKTGSITEAATLLRISQSAASKRLSQLESLVGETLVQRIGRRSTLTEHGREVATNASESLEKLSQLLQPRQRKRRLQISIGVSESILCSWGAKVLVKVDREFPNTSLSIHSHRSPVIFDKLNLGNYDLGLCAVGPRVSASLQTISSWREQMSLYGPSLGPASGLISIEANSETWKAIKGEAIETGIEPRIRVEGFSAAIALADAGFGKALVPKGLARCSNTRKTRPIELFRPIALVCRKSFLFNQDCQTFLDSLSTKISNELEK